jgi:hypothetical protein
VWRKAGKVSTYVHFLILRVHTKGLLLEEQEAGVNQLEELGEVVEVVEDNELVGPSTGVVANCKEKTLAGNRGDDLLGKEGKKYAADCCEVEVVHLEQEVQLEGLAAAHELSSTEDYNVVCQKRDDADLESGQGGLAGDEAEVLRLVANNGLEDSLEDGPQLEAKWPVERGDAEVDDGRGTHDAR